MCICTELLEAVSHMCPKVLVAVVCCRISEGEQDAVLDTPCTNVHVEHMHM